MLQKPFANCRRPGPPSTMDERSTLPGPICPSGRAGRSCLGSASRLSCSTRPIIIRGNDRNGHSRSIEGTDTMLRLGVLGLGSVFVGPYRKLISQLEQSGQARLTAAFDIDRDKTAAIAAMHPSIATPATAA